MTNTVVRYEPRGAAAELFRARDPELCIVGAAGTGKSLACLYRMHLIAIQNPQFRGLIVRKTAVSLTSTTLVTFKKKVVAEAVAAGVVRWYGGSQQEAAGYYYENGAVINVGGMDKPEKIMSSEYDLVFADEATELTVDDWEAIGTRLRNGGLSWQQQMAAANPGHPTHWLKLRADEGKLRMLTSVHRDNPRFVNADGTLTSDGVAYMAKLDALTGVRRLRLREGKWAAAEGLIYEEWDPTTHLVDKSVIQPGWTRWLVIDFGFTNPFCAQWWAEDGDGRLYLYREIYKTKTLVEDHARHILSIVAPGGKWIEPKPRAVICDHDAEDRATLERHLGMSTSAASKTVKDGIQATQARLRPAGDGRPRLFICQDALVERDAALVEAKRPTCTVEEITGYIWDAQPGKQPKEAPVKADDHGMDTMRYMVAERDLGGRPSMRWLT
ncbi:PBSX family phage terminase large subunit [Kitasatospora sp. GAS204A]|uniref:phage terminase large subunit n=1 Tax=unclassified Kitasatospora TaxID=2633591 RepID=UPI0024756F98|nr:phage terminase large subunit [Kitasatospora sp. GAS204B]MDH6116897.1 PBSX family phage terminase large subunit [Kitasatospora sp. GAS204B]